MIVVKVDNTEKLYQYDINRLVIISGLDPGPTYEIHFSNNNIKDVIRKETTVDDSGNISAKIPNSLLQTTRPITLYVYGTIDNTSKTYYKSWLEIKARPKPDGYVLPDDEDDVETYTRLEKKIEENRQACDLRFEESKTQIGSLSMFVDTLENRAQEHDLRLDDIENGNTTVGKASYAEGADIANSSATDALGNDIPTTYATKSELRPVPIKTISTTLTANTPYNFGEQTELSLLFPTSANDGDIIYINFESGASATNLTVDATNTSDVDLIPEPNTGYEIYAKFNGSIWIVKYSEYTVSGV